LTPPGFQVVALLRPLPAATANGKRRRSLADACREINHLIHKSSCLDGIHTFVQEESNFKKINKNR
jgi:hypothetical protein